jgi:DHA1 family bicyclomycin/chloramphenicol resistance-like MFS transporter
VAASDHPAQGTLPPVRFLDRTTPPHIATLVLVTGLTALATSIFLPSLSRMATDLGTSYAVMQLAVSGFLLANAVLQLLVGPLADRFGRRPVLLGALGLFVVATVGTLLARDAGTFLLFRMLQATCAANVVLARAVVRDMVPEAEAASMIGYVTMGMALVPMLGPTVGGALDEVFGWRASFWFLLGAGVLVLLLVAADGGETARGGGRSFREQARHYPALLRARRFWAYALCATFASGAFFALLGGASYVAETVFGLSPLWTGIALGAPALGYAFGNFLSGRFAARVGTDRMALLGCLVATAGLGLSLLVTLAGQAHPLAFFGFCTTLGLGNGLALPSAMAGSISVRPDLAGTASGLSAALMTAGGAALSVLAAALLDGSPGPWPLQALMVGSSALAGLSLLLLRGTR